MFRDQFKTISGYHFYLKRIEKEMYDPVHFYLDPDLSQEEPDEYGFFYPTYQGWMSENHTTRPMFEIENNHCRSTNTCYMCNPSKHFWEDMQAYWGDECWEYESPYDPDLAATAGHP